MRLAGAGKRRNCRNPALAACAGAARFLVFEQTWRLRTIVPLASGAIARFRSSMARFERAENLDSRLFLTFCRRESRATGSMP